MPPTLPAAAGSPSDPAAVALCAGLGDPAFALLHHDAELTLSPSALSGWTDVFLRAHRAVPLIALDAVGLEIEAIAALTTAGAVGPLPFETSGGRLCIDYPLGAGEEVRLRIGYRIGNGQLEGRGAPKFNGESVWAGYSTSSWLPTLQDPVQRASLDLVLDVPAEWKVAASGNAVAASHEHEHEHEHEHAWAGHQATADSPGRARHRFTLAPAPPFLFGWAAGRFDEAQLPVDGVTLRALGPPGARLGPALALTAPMLRFLAAKTGQRYPAAVYTQVFVPGDAAQEAAGLAFLGAGSLDDVAKDPTEDWIFSHELSHQWFAWLVPCADFADFWLNEGFATFLVAAYKEEKWGPAAYQRELGLWRARSAKVHAAGKDAPLSLSGRVGPFAPATQGSGPRRGPADGELQARGVTYSRGALLLDHLRRALGEKAFWDGVARYVKAGQGAGARSGDLRTALEAASGKDLGPLWAERVWAAWSDWESAP